MSGANAGTGPEGESSQAPFGAPSDRAPSGDPSGAPSGRAPSGDPSGAPAAATLGGGCFWCLEAVFRRVDGVREVTSGYAGGHAENPSYRQVCQGNTGHAEVVQLRFDPEVVSYRELLEIFFEIHDPTTPDRQGADVGPQYRSIILWHDEAQRDEARAFMEALDPEGRWGGPLVTELAPLERFWPAEVDHHEYYERNPNQPYCRFVVAPKVRKAQEAFPDRVAT